MIPALHPPSKEIDVAFLVFVERYASDLLKWDILSFFAHHPDRYASASQVAREVGRSPQSVRPELGDFVLHGILSQSRPRHGPTLYRLTEAPHLRKLALKFAG
jgi:hypothetical protein